MGLGAPLTLVLGIRRIGETSLVKAFLEGRVFRNDYGDIVTTDPLITP